MSIFNTSAIPQPNIKVYDLDVVDYQEIMESYGVMESMINVYEAASRVEIARMNGEPVMEGVSNVVEGIIRVVQKAWDALLSLISSIIDFFLNFGKTVKEFVNGMSKRNGSPGRVQLWKKPEISETLDQIIKITKDGLNAGQIVDADRLPMDQLNERIGILESTKGSVKLKMISLVLGKDVAEDQFKEEMENTLLGAQMEEKQFSGPRAINPLLTDAMQLMDKPKSYKQTIEQLRAREVGDLKRLQARTANNTNAEHAAALTKFIRLGTAAHNVSYAFLGQVLNIWKNCVVKYVNQLKKAATTLAKDMPETNNAPDFKQRAKDRLNANKVKSGA